LSEVLNSGEKVCKKLTPFLSESPLTKSEIQNGLKKTQKRIVQMPRNGIVQIVKDLTKTKNGLQKTIQKLVKIFNCETSLV